MEQEMSPKQQKRMLRKQRKEEEKMQRQKQVRNKKITRWVIVLVIIVAAIWGMAQLGSQTNTVVVGEPNVIQVDDWVKGSRNAPVALYEYSDFQCPACGSYYPLVKQLVEDYGDRIAFVYRHFPLRSIHPNAQLAAQAAEAAGRQGKFFEMHDMLFENQSYWSNGIGAKGKFLEYAQNLGLDTDQFEQDIDDGQIRDKVNRDVAFGNKLGVNSTPSFFVDGEKVQNPQSLQDFKRIIDEALPDQEASDIQDNQGEEVE